MECLHGAPTVVVTTKNGKFHLCDNKNPTNCNFFCAEQDRSLFETALAKWRCYGGKQPNCFTHQKPAKMRVVKDESKPSFGRPFFVCGDRQNPCSYWQWGDKADEIRPLCHHGLDCRVRKVKKSGMNQGRLFFCCPNQKEVSCGYFEWKLPDAPTYETPHIEKVGCLYTYPPRYTYMISETGFTFQSEIDNPIDAYAEYTSQLTTSEILDEINNTLT